VLEAPYDVGEPRQGGVRPLNERRHPQGVLSGLREHRKDKVLEVGQPRVPTQLGVKYPGEQFHHRDGLRSYVATLGMAAGAIEAELRETT